MNSILRSLLVFVVLTAAGFAQAANLRDKAPSSSWELVDNQNPKLSYTTPRGRINQPLELTARGRITERMRVPGGWIYQTTVETIGEAGSVAMAMVFVPDSASDLPAASHKSVDDKLKEKK